MRPEGVPSRSDAVSDVTPVISDLRGTALIICTHARTHTFT
eukprot:COSAG03_NODE_21756_length_299_cov_38.665000_1_plen_40_part_10